MEEIIVYNVDDIELDKMCFTIPEKKKPSGFFSNIMYNNNEQLYLEIEAIKTNDFINESEQNRLLELDVNENNELLFFNKLDETFKKVAFDNKNDWFKKDIPSDVIDEFYTPIITEDNKFRANILEEDLLNVTNFKGDTIDFNSINNGERITFVVHLTGLRFYKTQFFCNLEIKQIVKVNNYQLVDYDSTEEIEEPENDLSSVLEEIDLENSEIVDLELPDNEYSEDKMNEINNDLELKLSIQKQTEKDIEELRLVMKEKEELLNKTNNELNELHKFIN